MSRVDAGEGPCEAKRRHAWVYESLVETIPGVRISTRVALVVQFLGFEAAVLGLAWLDRLPREAAVAGTVTVAVATAGSAAMTGIARAVRSAEAPLAHRRVLFGSRVEVVLALLALVGVLTYLLVEPSERAGLLESSLGPSPPAPAVFVLLLLLWDACYRIAAAWWAGLTALWRSLRWDVDPCLAARLRRADLLTLGFGLLQLALVPFVLSEPLLLGGLLLHVVAVVVVTLGALVAQ